MAAEFLCVFSPQQELAFLGFLLFMPTVLWAIWIPLRAEVPKRNFTVWLLRPWGFFIGSALVACLFKGHFIAYLLLLLTPYLLLFTFGPFLFCLVLHVFSQPNKIAGNSLS
ncbi:hypothetical protein ACD591_06130 [Rufibacter glacialis]|uniref:Uncharacterized protein n=1 Tax=Rufibacter glacialis TaxID=1259555 RepID=A0A5M8QDI1_9BACT|nr:hypothetical protein [Rufibacter glacialis]KAA6433238.1 hypothetical protein FOE74_12180 [Rufibacter glacialis]